jgi:hypothetical protein
MKSRLLTCAAAGLACTFPGLAGAQVSMPLDQITANVRAAGLQPLSRPMLRGAVCEWSRLFRSIARRFAA